MSSNPVSNNDKVIIAVDAMGGDNAPNVIIEGVNLSAKKNHNLFFKIFGNAELISPVLEKYKNLGGRYIIIHTTDVINSSDKPTDAIRNGRNSSLRLAVDSVKNGEASAIVSAGNTGALMVISKFVLSSIKGISRPAIIVSVPTQKNPCILLDLGANSSVTKEQLLQFAIMGDAYAKTVWNIKQPRIALLNIGSESLKGNDLVQDASELISKYSFLNYVGFAEGDDIFTGNFDVIVTDGFTGNVALKVVEGTLKFIKHKIQNIFKKSLLAKIGGAVFLLLAFGRTNKLKKEIDPRNYNGAMLIGLNGISIKSHGNTDAKGFANAINMAYLLVKGQVNEQIKEELSKVTW